MTNDFAPWNAKPGAPLFKNSVNHETDWLDSVQPRVIEASSLARAASNEADTWISTKSAAVMADSNELTVQALGYADLWAGQFGAQAPMAKSAFMSRLVRLGVGVDEYDEYFEEDRSARVRYEKTEGGDVDTTKAASLRTSAAPTYEARGAGDWDGKWVPAGESFEEAEQVMKGLYAGGQSTLVLLKNNFNQSMTVFEVAPPVFDARPHPMGNYEQFYGRAWEGWGKESNLQTIPDEEISPEHMPAQAADMIPTTQAFNAGEFTVEGYLTFELTDVDRGYRDNQAARDRLPGESHEWLIGWDAADEGRSLEDALAEAEAAYDDEEDMYGRGGDNDGWGPTTISSRRTAASPDWLRERVNDPYGTPNKVMGDDGEYADNPFWVENPYEDINDFRVIERDGKGYVMHRRQNYWMNFNSRDEAVAHARGADGGLDMWAAKAPKMKGDWTPPGSKWDDADGEDGKDYDKGEQMRDEKGRFAQRKTAGVAEEGTVYSKTYHGVDFTWEYSSSGFHPNSDAEVRIGYQGGMDDLDYASVSDLPDSSPAEDAEEVATDLMMLWIRDGEHSKAVDKGWYPRAFTSSRKTAAAQIKYDDAGDHWAGLLGGDDYVPLPWLLVSNDGSVLGAWPTQEAAQAVLDSGQMRFVDYDAATRTFASKTALGPYSDDPDFYVNSYGLSDGDILTDRDVLLEGVTPVKILRVGRDAIFNFTSWDVPNRGPNSFPVLISGPDGEQIVEFDSLAPLPSQSFSSKSAVANPTLEMRPIYEIAADIKKEWGSKVNFGAVPYLDAMMYISSASDMFYSDSGTMIVSYFLTNASSFRGDRAKELKNELKRHIGRTSSKTAEKYRVEQRGTGTSAEGNTFDSKEEADAKAAELNAQHGNQYIVTKDYSASRKTASPFTTPTTCTSCGASMMEIDAFPGNVCLECHAASPEGQRVPTAQEVVEMWGGTWKGGSRRRAQVDENSQSGHGKSTLPDVDVQSAPGNLPQGWLDDDDAYGYGEEDSLTDDRDFDHNDKFSSLHLASEDEDEDDNDDPNYPYEGNDDPNDDWTRTSGRRTSSDDDDMGHGPGYICPECDFHGSKGEVASHVESAHGKTASRRTATVSLPARANHLISWLEGNTTGKNDDDQVLELNNIITGMGLQWGYGPGDKIKVVTQEQYDALKAQTAGGGWRAMSDALGQAPDARTASRRTALPGDTGYKPDGARPQTPLEGHDDSAMFEPDEILGQWDEENTATNANTTTASRKSAAGPEFDLFG